MSEISRRSQLSTRIWVGLDAETELASSCALVGVLDREVRRRIHPKPHLQPDFILGARHDLPQVHGYGCVLTVAPANRYRRSGRLSTLRCRVERTSTQGPPYQTPRHQSGTCSSVAWAPMMATTSGPGVAHDEQLLRHPSSSICFPTRGSRQPMREPHEPRLDGQCPPDRPELLAQLSVIGGRWREHRHRARPPFKG